MIDDNERKIQYILDEQGKLTEMYMEDAREVEYPINHKIRNAFEVYTRVDGTENYWISNYGRCVNNLNHKDKGTFYEHRQGKRHITVFEIERCPIKNKRGVLTGEIAVNRYKRETSLEELVAKHFLVSYEGRKKIWHKDGDESNNWYKNLIYVSPDDYKRLKANSITWQELKLEQKYIEFKNKAGAQARKAYERIKARCGDTVDKDYMRSCYDKSVMWQVWLDEPREFMKWYLEHYYECGDEEMDVDKDLFGDGSGMYHKDFCCLLPKGLNTLLANSKKHYEEGQTPDKVLPLGVRYNSKTNKYHAEIQFTGAKEAVRLSEWDTAEEAFAEYKIMKKADILRVVAEYKDKIPEYVYKKFLEVEIRPY